MLKAIQSVFGPRAVPIEPELLTPMEMAERLVKHYDIHIEVASFNKSKFSARAHRIAGSAMVTFEADTILDAIMGCAERCAKIEAALGGTK